MKDLLIGKTSGQVFCQACFNSKSFDDFQTSGGCFPRSDFVPISRAEIKACADDPYFCYICEADEPL